MSDPHYPAGVKDSLMTRKKIEDIQKRLTAPSWFGRALAIAQHQDTLNSWPSWKRWMHRKIVGRKCECCIAWREQQDSMK